MGLMESLGLNIPNSKDKEYTQDYIPIKDIENGIIETTDGEFIAIVEITPTNFFLKPASEQELCIEDYAAWLKIAPKEFLIKVITKTANTSMYINNVYEKIRNEKSKNCIALAHDYIELIASIGSRTAIERHFYMIFKYEPEHEMMRTTDPAEIRNIMLGKIDEINMSLSGIGNPLIIEDNPNKANKATGEFLYNYYNRKSSISEPFEKRIDRIVYDMMIVNNIKDEALVPPVDVKDIIAPRTIDTTSSPDYIVVDGIYKTHLCFKGETIPQVINVGWLNPFITMGNGIDFDIYIKKEDQGDFIQKTNLKLKLSRVKMNSRNEIQSDYEEIGNNIDSCEFFKQALNQNNEDAYNMCFVITINATTTQELYIKKSIILSELKKRDIKVLNNKYIEEDIENSVSPFLTMNNKVYKKTHRNTTTSGIACSYPYTAFELCDKNGILFGINKENQTMCVVDLFDTQKYRNANLVILGATGAGKSYLLQLMALRMRYMGIQNFIISPDKQDEFRRSCKAVGGTFINISPSSKDCINIMEIFPSVSPANDFLNGESVAQVSWLSEKIGNVKTFLSLLIPNLSNGEKAVIETLLMQIYNEKGITDINDSIYIDPSNKSKGKKEMPILEDLYKKLRSEKEKTGLRQEILDIMSKFITGAARSFNGHTNVDLDNKYIVFGLENLFGTELLAPGMFIALSFILSKVKEDKTKEKAIFIDEGWPLIDGTNDDSGRFVERLFKTVRGWGGSAIFATQSLTDLFKSNRGYGSSIISCSQTKVVLGMEENEISYVAEVLGLSPNEQNEIRKYKQGSALVCAGVSHIPVKIKGSELEHTLITTKRDELEQQYNDHLRFQESQK